MPDAARPYRRLFRYDPGATDLFEIEWDGEDLKVGTVLYWIQREHIHEGWIKNIYLRQPGRTNLSGVERVRGWLGTTDNVQAEALGGWRIVEINPAKGEFVAEEVE